MQNKSVYIAIAVGLTALTAVATPAAARKAHHARAAAATAAVAKTVNVWNQCDDTWRGNIDWASIWLDSGHGLPYYDFPSLPVAYYDHGPCP